MARSKHYYIRKAHRYLGVLLGIQFLFWTVSGMYFSWSNMDKIHGDFEKRSTAMLPATLPIVPPSIVLDHLVAEGADSMVSFQILNINENPVYQLRFIDNDGEHQSHSHEVKVQLADALTGK